MKHGSPPAWQPVAWSGNGCRTIPGPAAAKHEAELLRFGESVMDHLKVHIRWMIRRDMEDVVAIENESFDVPWEEKDFVQYLRQRNCIGMVAEKNDQIHGFMIYELHKSRLHVINFAVRRAFRRQGVGRAMVAKLIGKLSTQRRRVTIPVIDKNLDAHLFFKSQGFFAIYVLKDYYDIGEADAYLMQYRSRKRKTEHV